MAQSPDDTSPDSPEDFFLESGGDELPPPERPTNDSSRPYEREIVRRVWSSAQVIEGNDPEIWRKDEFGAWIHLLDYRNRNSEFGWEIIDHSPWRHGLGISLLRPCQWENYLDYDSSTRRHQITARGLKNVRELL